MLHSDQNFPDTPELPGNRTGTHPANRKEKQPQRLEPALQDPGPAFQLARPWAEPRADSFIRSAANCWESKSLPFRVGASHGHRPPRRQRVGCARSRRAPPSPQGRGKNWGCQTGMKSLRDWEIFPPTLGEISSAAWACREIFR